MSLNSKLQILPSIIIATLMIAGCYKASDYSGDGQLMDNGSTAATERYILTLGPVDLSQKSARTYRIKNLPEENFVAGIEITFAPEDRDAIKKREARPTILLELIGPGSEVVFTREARLDNWTWSFAAGDFRTFVYGRDEQQTYFQPRTNVEYYLTFSVLETDAAQLKYTATLIAKSGGWK